MQDRSAHTLYPDGLQPPVDELDARRKRRGSIVVQDLPHERVNPPPGLSVVRNKQEQPTLRSFVGQESVSASCKNQACRVLTLRKNVQDQFLTCRAIRYSMRLRSTAVTLATPAVAASRGRTPPPAARVSTCAPGRTERPQVGYEA